jgi:hypothetical protein
MGRRPGAIARRSNATLPASSRRWAHGPCSNHLGASVFVVWLGGSRTHYGCQTHSLARQALARARGHPGSTLAVSSRSIRNRSARSGPWGREPLTVVLSEM